MVGRTLLEWLITVACSVPIVGSDKVEIVDVSFSGRRLSGNGHEAGLPENVTVGFRAHGVDFQLQLWRNRVLLPLNARHIVRFRDGSTMLGPLPDPCYYIGTVTGDTGGSAGFSGCGGHLDGLVLGHGRAVRLEEVEGSRYEATLITDENLNEMLKDVKHFNAQDPLAQKTGRRLADAATKHVEVLVVNDYRRATEFGGQSGLVALSKHSADVMNLVTTIYRTTPQGGGAFPYNIQVVLIGQHTLIDADPWENSVVMSGAETDCSSLLTLFNDWGVNEQQSGFLSPHDNRVLLSGRNFDGSTVGLAGVSAMCNPARSGSVNMCGKESKAASCAGVVAHEMGHNFGMHHDSSGNACAQSGQIMEAVGTSGEPSSVFSSCSVNYITTYFSTTYPKLGKCLENMPSQVFGDPVCKNGLVEKGEDCDCGKDDCTGIDACCNGETCKFSESTYECSAQAGDCCDSCMFVTKAASKTCRAAKNVCDMEEKCVGGTALCPLDDYYYPGKACKEGTFDGLCSMGICGSLDQTCKVDITRDFDGTFDLTEKCAAYDDACGNLVCHDATSSKDYKCAQRFSTHGKQMPVPDGSPCWFMADPVGQRKGMCYQGKCTLPFALASVSLCGNGGIDFGEECDCGWAGGDSCCECTTCKLKSGNKCASLEPCCDACQFTAKSTTCRAAVGACDVAEVCSGTSGVCPPDVGKKWGTACTASDSTSSTCYGKVCLKSLGQQCSDKTEGANPKIHSGLKNSDCKALMCCNSAGSCTALTSSSTFTITDSKGVATVSKIYLGGALDGTILSDKTQMCMNAESWTPKANTSCTSSQFAEESVGRCLSCASSCADTCTGPTNLHCASCKLGTKDSRGACNVTAESSAASSDSVSTSALVALAQPARHLHIAVLFHAALPLLLFLL